MEEQKDKINLLCTICARAGSKGVKSKNSRIFLDYPLVYYTLAAYQLYRERYGVDFGSIMLALNTDSAVLIEQCKKTKLQIEYVDRKEALADDVTAKADVICDTLKQMELRTGRRFDMVLDLDVTSPLRTAEDMAGCIQALLRAEKANVAYTVAPSRRSPYFNMVKPDEEGYLEPVIAGHYTTRQEAPVCYDMNASVYAYRREPLLKTREQDVFQGKTVGRIVKDTAVLDIDSEEDYELLTLLADHFFRQDREYGEIRDQISSILR